MNSVRGEHELILHGQTFRLCLTLQALAEMEDTLGIEDLTKIQEALSKPRVGTILKMVSALMIGAGHTKEEVQVFASLPLDMSADLQLITAAMLETFAKANKAVAVTEKGKPPGPKQRPQR